MAILVLDDKLDCFGILRKKFVLDKNGPAFNPGPVVILLLVILPLFAVAPPPCSRFKRKNVPSHSCISSFSLLTTRLCHSVKGSHRDGRSYEI